jgi:hypothetical protein
MVASGWGNQLGSSDGKLKKWSILMETTSGQVITQSSGSPFRIIGQAASGWSSRGLVIAVTLTTVAAVGALALGQRWFAVVNLLPLL